VNDLVPSDDGRVPSPEQLSDAMQAIRPELDEQLQAVINELSEIADRDCYHSPSLKSDCDCETCVAKRAIAKIERIQVPVVRSLHPKRLNYAEAVYFEQWVKQNTRMRGVNGGYGTLELILSTQVHGQSNHRIIPAFVSQRDMDVATAVVQWLGTNCGQGFIHEAERETKKRQGERSDFEHVGRVVNDWSEYREKPIYTRVADRIAELFFPEHPEKKERLVKEIRRAMIYARQKSEVEAVEARVAEVDSE
jgi:hypothetical protein